MSRSACYFEIVQRQFDVNSGPLFEFMSNLAFFLLSSVKPFRQDLVSPRWRVRTYSLAANLILINYLTIYPLFSSKYLDFRAWQRAVLLIQDGKHLNSEGKLILSELKLTMNNSRTIFNWDHLSNFYK